MPRGFTEQEQIIIKEKLIKAGIEAMTRYGIRKSTVDELSKAAGISKGAFYRFFDSKEALFLQVLEVLEEDFRVEIIKAMQEIEPKIPREQVAELLLTIFEMYRVHPVFSHFDLQDYEVLTRKLPPEEISAHIKSDDVFSAELLNAWQGIGIEVSVQPEMVAALIKTLFFTAMHADEVGEHFQPAFEVLVNLLAGYLTGK